RLSLLLAVLGVAACGETGAYIYTPAVNANARADGAAAAHYAIPPESPRGDVRVASFGLTEVQPQGGGEKMSVLHIRMIVAHNGDPQPGWLASQSVLATIPGAGQPRPAFVNTDAGQPPILEIPQGQQRVIDFFYPAPPGMSKADKLP